MSNVSATFPQQINQYWCNFTQL